MEVDPWIAPKVNRNDESVLFVGCERGKLDVVKHLLVNHSWLLMLELDAPTISLHAAASGGHTACSKGHLEITRELLRLDPDLTSLQDNDGRTPLHWAAMKGRVNIIDEILSVSLQSAEMRTEHGETVLHLGVKNNQYEAVKYLTETPNISQLLNTPDSDGNTIFHLATAEKLTTLS
ncbi:Ankyrin repeat-containing protein ITN1 [Vitis vinifera]|uniref:Ankyrin repeat-containing protein ITN1 n=1 Tax=Vitis vinifera TaxID=29760 RepID=A0A438C289_VITVI|nr:Ankyrin repeat-containing protein ITN1 [Vitis vinifera]